MGFTDQVLGVLRDRAAEDIVSRYRKVAQPAIPATLPRAARAGDEAIVLVDAANGACWRFVHLPDASPYPWKHIGGPPLFHDVEANEPHPTNDNTVKDLATPGPKISLPFPGLYDVAFGAEMYNEVASHYTVAHLGYGPVAGAPAGWTSLTSADTFSSAGTEPVPASRVIAATLGTAGYELRVRYLATAGVGRFRKRFLRVSAVRVAAS